MDLMKFLDESQVKSLNAWMTEKNREEVGTIGGRFTWEITHTSLGVVIVVKDNLIKDQIDLTDYFSW